MPEFGKEDADGRQQQADGNSGGDVAEDEQDGAAAREIAADDIKESA